MMRDAAAMGGRSGGYPDVVPDRIHFEPFLQLADVADDEALIAWGGFYFRHGDSPYGEWRIVDDEELRQVAGPDRSGTIGASSEPYGEAVVEVTRDGEVVAHAETAEANHAWVRGLEPNTEYGYRVLVDDEEWAAGERWDWSFDRATLARSGRRYENRFRTFPREEDPRPITFAAIGDFGIGIFNRGEGGRRQIALAGALERAVDATGARLLLTTGDNVYIGPEGTPAGTGNEDDDWYSSFYQPYRYLLNRLPVFPTVGNHDAGDSERSDDRDQLVDNMFCDLRFRPEIEAGRASLGPGLFYRLKIGSLLELICIDTSIANEPDVEHYFDDPEHARWVRDALAAEGTGARWRIPFSHHPPFCAGPEHGPTPGMVERLVPLFEQAGVRIVLSGHEHNFQRSVVNGIDYLVSGAGGKLRPKPPATFDVAGTREWAAEGHFLVVEAEEDRLTIHPVRAVGGDGSLQLIERRTPAGDPVTGAIEIGWRRERRGRHSRPSG
jgi:tartrate-resistant acid phosphatase type 5